MANLIQFLKKALQQGGKFTAQDFMKDVDIRDADVILKQLERWGYIEKIGDKVYQVKREPPDKT